MGGPRGVNQRAIANPKVPDKPYIFQIDVTIAKKRLLVSVSLWRKNFKAIALAYRARVCGKGRSALL